MPTLQPLSLELRPKDAALLWQCVVSAKSRVIKHEFEQMDTYGPETSTRLREAANQIDYLGWLAKELAIYCRDNGVEVGYGK